MLPLYLHFVGVPAPSSSGVLEAAYLCFIAFMMVSRVPTFAGKTLGVRVPHELVIPLLIIMVLFVALLASHPFHVLLALTLIYLGLIPFGVTRYRAREQADRREQLTGQLEQSGV